MGRTPRAVRQRTLPIPDGLVHQFSSDGTVDTTADCPNYSSLRPTDLTDARDFLANEFFLARTPEIVSSALPPSGCRVTDHRPVCRTVADVENELSDDFSPAWRVGDLRVELNTIPWLIVMGDGCKGGSGCMSDDMEVGRDFGELIPMGHPDLEKFRGKSE